MKQQQENIFIVTLNLWGIEQVTNDKWHSDVNSPRWILDSHNNSMQSNLKWNKRKERKKEKIGSTYGWICTQYIPKMNS